MRKVFTKGRFSGSPLRNIAAQSELKHKNRQGQVAQEKTVRRSGCTIAGRQIKDDKGQKGKATAKTEGAAGATARYLRSPRKPLRAPLNYNGVPWELPSLRPNNHYTKAQLNQSME